MDRIYGLVGFSTAVAIYVYYTVWVVLTPFIDEKVVWFHSIFPDRWCSPSHTFLSSLSMLCVWVWWSD